MAKAPLDLLTISNLEMVLKMLEDSIFPQQKLHANSEHGSLVRRVICSAVALYTLIVAKKREKGWIANT
jgi:hypothetical protein